MAAGINIVYLTKHFKSATPWAQMHEGKTLNKIQRINKKRKLQLKREKLFILCFIKFVLDIAGIASLT